MIIGWACDNGMTRTPNEIMAALTRDEMNQIHAYRELQYYEYIEDLPGDEKPESREKKDREKNKKRAEKYQQWLDELDMTAEEKAELKHQQKIEAAQRKMAVKREGNKFANNQ